MEKRNKKWRQEQMFRVFKARLMRMAAYSWMPVYHADGTIDRNPHWFEIAKTKWARPYKSTGTPCSCWICRKARYSRKDFKKETSQMIKDELSAYNDD